MQEKLLKCSTRFNWQRHKARDIPKMFGITESHLGLPPPGGRWPAGRDMLKSRSPPSCLATPAGYIGDGGGWVPGGWVAAAGGALRVYGLIPTTYIINNFQSNTVHLTWSHLFSYHYISVFIHSIYDDMCMYPPLLFSACLIT